MGWGPLGKKERGKREEVACGSVIECRSGLSWWGGGDDKVEWRAGVLREDYKAFGSLMSPVGWPQALHITCFPILCLSHFFSCCCYCYCHPKHKVFRGVRLFKCSVQCIYEPKYLPSSTSLRAFNLRGAGWKIFVSCLEHMARVN